MPRAGHQKEKDKNMESQKNITIYDIAQATNLSIATISRIINKKGRYSAETESRVIKAMEELIRLYPQRQRAEPGLQPDTYHRTGSAVLEHTAAK